MLNFSVVRGTTFHRTVRWSSGGSPVDLSDYDAELLIKNNLNDVSSVLAMTVGNGRITLGGAAATIDLDISSADTPTVPEGSYVYELTLTSVSITKRLLTGIFTFTS